MISTLGQLRRIRAMTRRGKAMHRQSESVVRLFAVLHVERSSVRPCQTSHIIDHGHVEEIAQSDSIGVRMSVNLGS